MKNFINFFILFALIACSGSDEPAPAGVDCPNWEVAASGDECPAAPEWTADGIAPDPVPEWTQPDYSIYSSSMMAVVRLPEYLRAYESADDLFAAFIGDEVRGISKSQNLDGDFYYVISIKANEDERQSVVFKYYSRRLQSLFIADDKIGFGIDKMLGTVAAPWVPQFVGERFCQACVEIPAELLPHATSADKLALFVGDQCRGTGQRINNGTYRMVASLREGETYVWRYYNARLGYVFSTVDDRYAGGAMMGSERNPYRLAFNLACKTPLHQTIDVTLPTALAVDASAEDRLGVFVGSQCRGVAPGNATGRIAVVARGGISADEKASIRYYSAKNRCLYTSADLYTLDGNDKAATPDFKKD